MKKITLLLLLSICFVCLNAAPFSFLPYTIIQPNGEVIECFVSGDEYYNWIHDKDGYTIIQDSDGFYYYASSESGNLVPSAYKVNKVKPENIGLKKWIKISNAEYQKRAKRYQAPALKSSGPIRAPLTGTMNNIVIYIRFSDDPEIQTTRQTYDNKLNLSSGVSLKTYFNEVSYNQLNINSTHYPLCPNPETANLSYQDSHSRKYFKKYNVTTNPDGYQNDTEAKNREHQLLKDAVTWINLNYPIDNGLNIDADNDGYVDNVCFMIKGNSEGWSDLLWAHRWSLNSKTVSINGKRVWDYTFQPENQVTVRTLCHEMFHALGAPDLYHYDEDYDNLAPVGYWDIMESGSGHMGAYMKWKYTGGTWISSIPEITTSGTYSLDPLTSSTNNCFKIASPNSSNEFFVLEFRRQTGSFEINIPGEGLLVYRINTNFNGNSGYDNISSFDEVYIYRPNGTTSVDGSISTANLSSNVGRTAMNDATTNPKSFLTNGLPGGLDISNVSSVGSTISFYVYLSSVLAPDNFVADGISDSQINLSWALNSQNNDVLVAYSLNSTIGSPTKGANYTAGSEIPGGGMVLYSGNANSFNHTSLTTGTNYFYKIWSKNSSSEYSPGVSTTGATYCQSTEIPVSQGFNGAEISPCWTVKTVALGEQQEERASITQVQSGTYPDAVPFEGTHMIKFNSTYCGVGNKMRLVSPPFSTAGQNQLLVTFAWHKDTKWPESRDYMTIQWSTDGLNWNDGNTYERYYTVTGWTQQEYKLPNDALGHENVQIGFLFTSLYGYNCYLDKLRIRTGNPTISEDLKLQEFQVYPNPSKGLIRFNSCKSYSRLQIEVFDLNGKKVYSEIFKNSENIIDIGKQPKGVYLLKIQADGDSFNQKVVIE